MLGQLSNKSDRLNEFKKKAPRCYQKIILQKKLILRGKMRPIILSEGFPGWSASSFGIRIKEKDLFLLDGFHRALAFTLLKKKPRTISCVVAIM